MEPPSGFARPRHAADAALARSVVARREGAWATFLQRVGEALYGLAREALGEDADAEYVGLLEAVRQDDFRVLREYDGRASLEAYLRLQLVDLIGARILDRFERDPSGAWLAFERVFRPELMRIVGQVFPAREEEADGLPGREDAYQELSVSLIADGCRRIRAFDGRGRFSAYVRRVARNLCTDVRRRAVGRVRLPEAVKRRPALGQEAYRLLHWRGLRVEEAVEALRASVPEGDEASLRAAVTRAAELPHAPGRPHSRTAVLDEPPDERLSPEEMLLGAESRARTDGYLDRLERAVASLAPDERLYVRLRFFDSPPAAPREIARLMGRTPSEVYKLRDRVMGALKRALAPS